MKALCISVVDQDLCLSDDLVLTLFNRDTNSGSDALYKLAVILVLPTPSIIDNKLQYSNASVPMYLLKASIDLENVRTTT